ncbi:hypothetical protein N0V88_001982 [Collariella sp. IMI 366227]|nr:hypothetical protein N0V88_001982 [Collariella sp. IMI 366227]
MGSLVATFANTFLLSNNGCGGPVLKVVGPEELRKKRPHRCDEGDPCKNCVKRKETCIRRSPAPSHRGGSGLPTPPLTSPPRELGWSLLSEPESGPINLLHMELLHHFERHSIPTLPFGPVWPRMLQLAFQSGHRTYLINATLSFAAAHLSHLLPSQPQYHRAKSVLLDKALHDYRTALSAPLTSTNCDALLGTANLVQFLMWSDLSFIDGSGRSHSHSQTLYWLSAGVRQIFFMAWPLFQTSGSVFQGVGLLQPCMVLEEVVDARGLNWRRYLRTPPYKIMTLWQSYKEGEAYVKSAGAQDEALTRAAYKRLVSRVAVAMALTLK